MKTLKGILQILLLLAILLPATVYFMLKLPAIQTYIIQKITNEISQLTQTKVSIKSVNYKFFKSLVLEDLFIEDTEGDTLVSVAEVEASLASVWFSQKKINLSSVILTNGQFNLITTNDTLNLDKLLLRLSSGNETSDTTSTKKGYSISTQQLKLRNFKFSLQNRDNTVEEIPSQINFENLRVSDINLVANHIRFAGDTVFFDISDFSFCEKSGFHISALTTGKNSYVCSHRAYLPKLNIVDDYTNLKFDYYAMNFPHGDVDLDDYLHEVCMEAYIASGYVAFKTIGFFAHDLASANIIVFPRGKVNGTVADMHTENFNVLSASGLTHFSGDISFAGLPDIDNTMFSCNNLKISTNIPDLNKTIKQIIHSNESLLGDEFNAVKNINVSGEFHGFYNNFSLAGLLNTNLGEIKTDAKFDFSSQQNDVEVIGNFILENFDVGKFFGTEIIKNVSANIDMRGVQPKNKDFNLYGEGKISQFIFNERKYNDIDIAGTLYNDAFDGKVTCNDEQLKFDFIGRVDMKKTAVDDYRFNFTANINYADLYKLKLKTDDTVSVISGKIVADLRGKNINFGGNVKLQNIKYKNSHKIFDIGNIQLQAIQTDNIHRIFLQSAYFDASYYGNLNIENFITDAQYIASKYVNEVCNTVNYNINSKYELNIKTKKLHDLMRIINSEIFVAENSFVNIKINDGKDSIKVNSDFIGIGDIMFKHIDFKGNSDTAFMFAVNCNEAIIGGVDIKNIGINGNINNNKISSYINYNNKTSAKNKGNINLQTQLFKNDNGEISCRFKIDDTSQIIVNDVEWNFGSNNIRIKKDYYEIGNFEATSGLQKISINGTYSLVPTDTLHFGLTNFEIANFNPIFESEGYKLDGYIDGRARIINVGGNTMFFSDVQTSDIRANNWLLGKISMRTRWRENTKNLDFLAQLTKNNNEKLNVRGSYSPSKNYYDLTFDAKKLEVKVIEPLIANELNNIEGNVSGIVNLKGVGGKLKLTGNALLDTLGFTVDFLKTHYTVSSLVNFGNDKIQMQNATLYDAEHNKGRLNVTVTHKNLKDFLFDINLNADKLLGLKTTQKDNYEFYGDAYISGPIRMNGKLTDLKFNINVNPEKNTRIIIPVNNTNVSQKTFLTFERADSVVETNDIDKFIAQQKQKHEENVKQSDLAVSLTLTMNKNAEVKLVIDENTGDAITVTGDGALQMSIIPREEKFKLQGNYIIENGNFRWTFPMFNFMTKEFSILKESQINFNGDMSQTKIDITAHYTKQLQLSLRNLLSDTTISKIKYPVVCGVQLTGNISSFNIKPIIDIQNIDIDTKARAQSMLNTDEKLWKQFMYLLISGNFLAEEQMGSVISNASITSNLSEILSNQLSSWFASLKLPFDVGFNIRTGNTSANTEFDAHASFKIFEDKVVFNGRVGSAPRTSTSDIAGDFDVDIKLNNSGSLKTKIFRRSTDEYAGDAETSRQGIRVSYQGGFNTWKELWNSIFHPKQERERRERIRQRREAVQDSLNYRRNNLPPVDTVRKDSVP